MHKHQKRGLWLCFIYLTAVWSWVTLPVKAHDGPPAVVLGQYQVAPGASVEIRGINLLSDLPVQVVLTANGRDYLLGEALCDGHGDFTRVFTLPADLATAVYLVQAVDTNIPGLTQVLATTTVKIDPTPIPDNEIATSSNNIQRQPSRLPLLTFSLAVLCLFIVVVRWRRQARPTPTRHPS